MFDWEEDLRDRRVAGRVMKNTLIVILLFLPGIEELSAKPQVVRPFEIEAGVAARNIIDAPVLKTLREQGIEPANLASDEVFFRRVHLDVIGTLPDPRELRKFLRNRAPDKRAALIDSLLERPEFADYWSLKWCDLLRVKAEFPINLWPNAVQAYYRWIHTAIRENLPYDRFARELLTSSGSNFRVPQVNFYRAVQGQEPSTIAAAVALTFMGVRSGNWPEERQADLAAFFSRIAFKKTAEWKEEIVYRDPGSTDELKTAFPDGSRVTIKPGDDPRRIFADWLIAADNDWFVRNIVNRIWSWFLGRGLIDPADDIRSDNPPVIPELLTLLERELVAADYDLRHIFRLILNSRTYQQSSIPNSIHRDAERYFACYPVRPLEAEVLIDALCWISGTRESYSSPIPEPFTFIPENQRSITLADGSISSQFLEMFGRPARDTGLEAERNREPTDAQRLHMLNSSHIQNKIERSWRLRNIVKAAKGKRPAMIRQIYFTILSRLPTEAELAAVEGYFRTSGLNQKQVAADLAWALINSKEFLYRH